MPASLVTSPCFGSKHISSDGTDQRKASKKESVRTVPIDFLVVAAGDMYLLSKHLVRYLASRASNGKYGAHCPKYGFPPMSRHKRDQWSVFDLLYQCDECLPESAFSKTQV